MLNTKRVFLKISANEIAVVGSITVRGKGRTVFLKKFFAMFTLGGREVGSPGVANAPLVLDRAKGPE